MSAFHCDLIAAAPGHASESELAIFELLKQRHAVEPYQWVFMGYDASQKQGEFALEGKELAIDAYRNFPNAKVIADIVRNYLERGTVASPWAFGLVAEPVCRILPLDDWYYWAASREALRQLDALSGRLAVAAALLERIPDGSVRQLLDLIRLRWTGSEWLVARPELMSLDVTRTLVQRRVAGAQPLARFLSELKELAANFYDASLLRTNAVVAGAIERMRQTGARRGAILIALPWIPQAGGALATADVDFETIYPDNLTMRPMLDDARLLLGALDEHNRRLGELFSGKRIRTRVEALLEDRPDLNKALAQDWAGAAQGLATRYEVRRNPDDLKKSEECVSRALIFDATMHHAWWVKGELLTLQRQHERALAAFDRALTLAPNEAHYWRAKGTALDNLGRTYAARRHFVRAIHISPRKGSVWTFLGIHYHEHGRRAAACYCFSKGKEYRDETAQENHRIVGCGRARWWSCPFALQPFVIRLMNRYVLPLRYGWGNARIGAALMAGAIFVGGAAIWGAVAGASSGGIWGGVVGFVTYLLGAAVTAVLLLVAGAAFTARPEGRPRTTS